MPIMKNNMILGAVFSTAVLLTGCSGDDGAQGEAGAQGPAGPAGEAGAPGTAGQNGADGSNGLQSLIAQTQIAPGNMNCLQGGVRIDSGLDSDSNGELESGEVTETSYLCSPTVINEAQNFNRISSFLVCSQIDETCDTDTETAAEIVAASTDGMTLVYSDSPQEQLGFVDITDPANPVAGGVLDLAGEPTSVAVKGDFALVAISTAADFVNVSGQLDVVNIETQMVVASLDLGGQPDSIAVSPDGNYAAVVIENERDEDLDEGRPPQLPAGSFIIVNTADADPANWTTSAVDLTGLADLFPSDPEPEYVDINNNNIAVISLQENNHLVLVDLTTGMVTNHFTAGDVDLVNVDLTDNRPAFIEQTESFENLVREPDGVAWINNQFFATADEGDLDGGSRGFTIYNLEGDVVWDAGSALEHIAVRLGHYPDRRSDSKGNEPENVEVGTFGSDRYLFVNSERSGVVFVYDVADPSKPVFKQTLPTAARPEGGLAIPPRNLLVVASEEDARDDKLRSVVNIYSYQRAQASYPTLYSVDRENGLPMPWGAMSGLAADSVNENILYSIEDSFYSSSRIFTIQTNDEGPARLISEMRITDADGVFAAYPAAMLADASVDDDDATRVGVFDQADLAAMINDDDTVNLDPEGIAHASDGGFWVASEGNGTIGDSDRPINSLNFIFKTDAQGVIENVISLPDTVDAMQLRFGFEGVAEWNGNLYVTFQRAWGGEANPRIGIYDIDARTWSFVFYPLDMPTSQNGGWVGLSDITSLGGGQFLVIERDNQAGPDAAIKRLYRINLASPVADSTISKTLVRDLIGDLTAPGGLIYEKIEGSAMTTEGDIYIINDNDGVNDNSGETQLINLGDIATPVLL